MTTKKDALAPADAVQIVPAGNIDWQALSQAALQLGPEGAEVVKQVLAMHREQKMLTAKEDFREALAKAKAEFPPIKRTREGAHTTHKGGKTVGNYAPLDEITQAIDPILFKYGLTYRWDREITGDREYIVFYLAKGMYEEARGRFPAEKDSVTGRNAIQAVASGETYAKRYSLCAGLGITGEDPDDDGEAAGAKEESRGPTISKDAAGRLKAALDSVDADIGRLLAAYEVDSLNELTEAEAEKVYAQIEAKRKKMAQAEADADMFGD